MSESSDHTAVLQDWLSKLDAADEVSIERIREAIINHSSGWLESLVRRMLKNYPRLRRWEQTGDVLQNSLMRLYQSLKAVRPDTVRQFYGLATTQVRRELIDLGRHHFGPQGEAAQHYTDAQTDQESGASAIDRQVSESSEPETLEDWARFHEAVQQLPDAEREVFELYWYEELDQQAIAKMLSVTDRTVKNRWRNAKLLIRQRMRSGTDEASDAFASA